MFTLRSLFDSITTVGHGEAPHSRSNIANAIRSIQTLLTLIQDGAIIIARNGHSNNVENAIAERQSH